jgi:hypothetical protein
MSSLGVVAGLSLEARLGGVLRAQGGQRGLDDKEKQTLALREKTN